MAKALREIKQRLQFVDVILEIRDARVPLASGNSNFDETIGNKPKLLVFNKANLVDEATVKKWEAWFTQEGVLHVFLNCFDRPSICKAIAAARKIVVDHRKACNPDQPSAMAKLQVMIIGLPNTGKSTIINVLSQKNAAKVADKPGQTLLQQWIQIPEQGIALLDTPGVMPPKIDKPVHALYLSAIHAIPDDVSDEQNTAVFLVKHLLARKIKKFYERYKLDENESDVDAALVKIATVRGCLRQKGVPDLDRVYRLVLADFRKGELGQTCLELPPR
jgi:ribosome biogenesis GTPase A